MTAEGDRPRSRGALARLADVRPGERAPLAWSLLLVFSLLAAYYVIRPIRDEMGVLGGVENLQWLFTATLVAMLVLNPAFSALVRRMPRERFLPAAYLFFAADLVAFAVVLEAAPASLEPWIGRVFFVWTSVFNLFVVSLFWALMVDVFDSEQGKRLFGLLAAGATIGAIAGSSSTASLVGTLGATRLMLASAAMLIVACVCVLAVARGARGIRNDAADRARETPGDEVPIGGSAWAGLSRVARSPYLLAICGYMLLFSITSTLLYFLQAEIVAQQFHDRAARTRFFASVDLMVNVSTLLVQLFLTGRVLHRFGVARTASILPALSVVGFGALALAPTVAVLVGAQLGRRVLNFGLARPTRELLFTVLSREDKYKAKNAIDTVVYRAGDQVGSWSYAALAWAGLGITGIALVALPLSVAWLAVSWWVGRRQENLAALAAEATPAAGSASDRGSTPALGRASAHGADAP
ncbi:MAG: MFS transporter [Burkholderiaceae bacterium]|nr:MFS transporter [Burkholderiaceae bacterium]